MLRLLLLSLEDLLFVGTPIWYGGLQGHVLMGGVDHAHLAQGVDFGKHAVHVTVVARIMNAHTSLVENNVSLDNLGFELIDLAKR